MHQWGRRGVCRCREPQHKLCRWLRGQQLAVLGAIDAVERVRSAPSDCWNARPGSLPNPASHDLLHCSGIDTLLNVAHNTHRK